MRNPVLRSSVLLAFLGATLSASAAQIVHSFSVTGVQSQVEADFDAFDPSLGTLTSVVIALNVANSGSVTLLNRGDAQNIEFSSQSYGQMVVTRPTPDGEYLVAVAYGTHDEAHSGLLGRNESFTNDLTYVGGVTGGFSFDNGGGYHDGSDGVFAGSAMEAFVARSSGERLHYYASDSPYYVASVGLTHSTTTLDFDGLTTGSLTYNYTPVPEPASLAALGLGAVAMVRRRKKA